MSFLGMVAEPWASELHAKKWVARMVGQVIVLPTDLSRIVGEYAEEFNLIILTEFARGAAVLTTKRGAWSADIRIRQHRGTQWIEYRMTHEVLGWWDDHKVTALDTIIEWFCRDDSARLADTMAIDGTWSPTRELANVQGVECADGYRRMAGGLTEEFARWAEAVAES